jgi:hypothetical protein
MIDEKVVSMCANSDHDMISLARAACHRMQPVIIKARLSGRAGDRLLQGGIGKPSTSRSSLTLTASPLYQSTIAISTPKKLI